MIRKLLMIVVLAVPFQLTKAQTTTWKPVAGKIMSPWAEQVDPSKPLKEYPRPQMVRNNWQNLNGIWEYAITPKSTNNLPAKFDGQILVPFAVESALSGVGKTVGKEQVLWYKNTIELAKSVNKDQVLLHFGAVDWQCDVYVNGNKVGSHEGGFDPFYFDITKQLKKGKKQEIAIRVWDPTDDGPQPRGKQVKNPEGIWYTPVTGIWQTVWVESVPKTFIAQTKQTPDVDQQQLKFSAIVEGGMAGDQLKIVAQNAGKTVSEKTIEVGAEASLPIANAKLWSPTSPHLYDLKISLIRKGKVVDEVTSYFAMRKISMAKDSKGIQRLLLNNKFVFQYGPLDQGWWPDGLYTAPTDEALLFDVIKTKGMGFNMIRKHIKVEPARWYRHCDSLGMLVWQDMPSGDLGGNRWDNRVGQISGFNLDKERSAESEAYHKKEWKSIMEALHNYPSIVVWVPFNEAWGQFKTKEITEWTMQNDPSRLVNSASGGNFLKTGHILDIHNYPDPSMPDPEIFGDKQVLVLGEFGGLGLPVEGHTWQQKDNWGYQNFKNNDELLKRYTRLMDDLKKLIPLGLSAGVYTQTTDVEVETNGMMTYDRKVIKIPEATLNQLHQSLYQATQ
ncbi:glycoside hydrolase family 2 protein [Olivibacter domesticus]|uniref:Glycosyl hydrolases family 2, TIM barrel domain n=1 Tax=Olivibacter domesticus TaxID=407022 RepID=A0A1H7T6U8_OLID1|nr:sugar-binding domain-containing protein [Olivibacter domesticus]SEL79986.1 Glycosyl hydrolases family 2, TIM barrel domain [Olivibacter domesticus]